jgi:hypothetical protein
MEWIRVKNRLPDDKSSFLGTNGELIFAAYWVEDSDFYIVGGWESCCYCGGASFVSFTEENFTTKKVTHWMPLPKLPLENE